MTDFNYKKYSLNQLENWVHDALSSGDATPQEIYDTIKGVVKESQEYHQKNERVASELLDLLSGNAHIKFKLDNVNYCGYGNTAEYCNNSWNDFWYSNCNNDMFTNDTNSDDVITFNESTKKWTVPVEVDGPSGEYFLTFPDDLLEAAKLQEGDEVYWEDNKNGTFTLRKVTKPLGMDEC